MNEPPRNQRRRRVTLAEMASALGVAPSTVSNAYNRPDQLSAELRARIMATATRLGYAGPDPAARSLRRGRAGALGLLYTDRLSYAFADPAAIRFLQGIARAAEDEGLGLLLLPGRSGGIRPTSSQAVVDGFIIYSLVQDDPQIAAALVRRLPTVLVDVAHSVGGPVVGIDDRGAAREAAAFLLGLGHRRLAVIAFGLGPEHAVGYADLHQQSVASFHVVAERLRGYTAAFAAAGLPWAGVPVYTCQDNTREAGREAALQLLARASRPTAILAMSDRYALGALDAAHAFGLTVPDDLSIVGFDDIPEAALTRPALTTIRQDHHEKGLRAGRLLIAQLRGEEAPALTLLPTTFIARESTAPPR
jgi:DNA-binding LacI/PurR family transcriptional regulator